MKKTSATGAAFLVLACLVLLGSCASFQGSMIGGDYIGAESYASKLQGAERRKAYAELGQAHAKKREHLDAMRCYLEAEDPEAVLAIVASLGSLFDPRMLDPSIAAVRMLKAAGKDARALAAAREVALLAGSLGDRAPREKIDALFAAAGLPREEAGTATGDSFLARALDPSLGLKERKELAARARELFSKAGAAEKSALASERLGALAIEEGEDEEAFKLFAEAGRTEAYAASRLGDHYAAKGKDQNIPRAITYYRRAGDEAAIVRIKIQSGRDALAAGKPAEALKAFADSGTPELIWAPDMAAYYEGTGEYSKAASYYEKTGDAEKTRAAWGRAGDGLSAQREYEKALEAYAKAKDEAKSKATMIKLGEVAKARKDFTAAQAWFEKAGAAKELEALRRDMAAPAPSLGERPAIASGESPTITSGERPITASGERAPAASGELSAAALPERPATALPQRPAAADSSPKNGSAADARKKDRALGEQLLAKRDYARAYALIGADDKAYAFEALIEAARANNDYLAVEGVLIAAGLPQKDLRERLAAKATASGDYIAALSLLDKAGSTAKAAEILGQAAAQTIRAGRLDEAYKLYLRQGKEAKDAQALLLTGAVGAGKLAEAQVYLEKSGLKAPEAAAKLADLAYAAGKWDLAAELYAKAGKKDKAADSYASAADSAVRGGDWEGAASYLAKSGFKKADVNRKLSVKAIELENYPKALELGMLSGQSELEAARKVAEALFAKQEFPAGYEYLKNHGSTAKEAAFKAGEAAAQAGDAIAAAAYYREAGDIATAASWEAKAAIAAFDAGKYDEGFRILAASVKDEKKAAELCAEAAERNGSAAAAVAYYLRAGLTAKASPLYDRASEEKAYEGDLDLALDYAKKAGTKSSIDAVQKLRALRDEMVAYIEQRGIEAKDFVDYLAWQEKKNGSRLVWETIKNSAVYYLGRGNALIGKADPAKISPADLAAAAKYTEYSKILSTIYAEMLKG